MRKNDNFTYFNLLILCMWPWVINKVKVTHQREGHIKVKEKYLCPFQFCVAHTVSMGVVCIRLKCILVLFYFNISIFNIKLFSYQLKQSIYTSHESLCKHRLTTSNFMCVSVCVSACLSVCLSVCVSVCLCICSGCNF